MLNIPVPTVDDLTTHGPAALFYLFLILLIATFPLRRGIGGLSKSILQRYLIGLSLLSLVGIAGERIASAIANESDGTTDSNNKIITGIINLPIEYAMYLKPIDSSIQDFQSVYLGSYGGIYENYVPYEISIDTDGLGALAFDLHIEPKTAPWRKPDSTSVLEFANDLHNMFLEERPISEIADKILDSARRIYDSIVLTNQFLEYRIVINQSDLEHLNDNLRITLRADDPSSPTDIRMCMSTPWGEISENCTDPCKIVGYHNIPESYSQPEVCQRHILADIYKQRHPDRISYNSIHDDDYFAYLASQFPASLLNNAWAQDIEIRYDAQSLVDRLNSSDAGTRSIVSTTIRENIRYSDESANSFASIFSDYFDSIHDFYNLSERDTLKLIEILDILTWGSIWVEEGCYVGDPWDIIPSNRNFFYVVMALSYSTDRDVRLASRRFIRIYPSIDMIDAFETSYSSLPDDGDSRIKRAYAAYTGLQMYFSSSLARIECLARAMDWENIIGADGEKARNDLARAWSLRESVRHSGIGDEVDFALAIYGEALLAHEIVEAKSRTEGYSEEDVSDALENAVNYFERFRNCRRYANNDLDCNSDSLTPSEEDIYNRIYPHHAAISNTYIVTVTEALNVDAVDVALSCASDIFATTRMGNYREIEERLQEIVLQCHDLLNRYL